MPKLKELTVTSTTPTNRYLIRQKRSVRYHYPFSNWMKEILQCNYDWRLTAFHLSHFEVESANSLKHFLRTHSPTLRDLTITKVVASDSNHLSAKAF